MMGSLVPKLSMGSQLVLRAPGISGAEIVHGVTVCIERTK